MPSCNICPRNCGIDRETQTGYCGAGSSAKAAAAFLHQWEEPCISGTRGSGTVFFSGCNLRCVFCQNSDISQLHSGREITSARLRDIYLELIDQGAHNINLVTPTHFLEAVTKSLEKPLPVPVVYNCGGYESVESLRRLEGKIQIYMPDLKYLDSALAGRYSSASDYPQVATAAIAEMYRQTGDYILEETPATSEPLMKNGVMMRHLILPSNIDNTLDVIDYFAENYTGGKALFSLMSQYYPRYRATEFPEINRVITKEEYERVESYLRYSPIGDGYIQGMDSADEKYIPIFDCRGI